MSKKIFGFITASCLFFCFLLIACAKEEPAAEKRAAMENFMQAIEAEKQYQQTMGVIAVQAQNRFAVRLRMQYRMFDVISQEKQSQIKGVMEGARKAFSAKFRAALTERVPYSEIKAKVYYPVYEKHFDTAELRTIVKFYESPVGKKLIALTPSIMQDTVNAINSSYGPKINDLKNSIADEELERIAPELQKIQNF